jgi:hypothetical protein
LLAVIALLLACLPAGVELSWMRVVYRCVIRERLDMTGLQPQAVEGPVTSILGLEGRCGECGRDRSRRMKAR